MGASTSTNKTRKKNPLVTAEWLKSKIDSHAHEIVILDCQYHLPATNRVGKDEYAEKHIPGALFFDISECRDKETDLDMLMLPKPEVFADYVSQLGVNNRTHLVLYDNNETFGLFSAQRVWWMFRVFGHPNHLISILNGGLPAWERSGYETTDIVPTVEVQNYEVSFRGQLVKSMDEVRTIMKENKIAVVDARPSGLFNGTAPYPKPGIKSGHMPGAENLPFPELIDKEKMFKSAEEIKQQFVKAGVDPTKPFVASCVAGLTSTMLILGAYVCGNDKAALYDGSLNEWFQKASPEEMVDVPDE